jgi:hypothetical protein
MTRRNTQFVLSMAQITDRNKKMQRECEKDSVMLRQSRAKKPLFIQIAVDLTDSLSLGADFRDGPRLCNGHY